MRLLELFSSETKWQWDRRSYDTWLASFEVEGVPYKAEFFGEDRVSYSFFVADDYNTMQITGSGNATKVFTTALEILRDFIDQRNPHQVSMSAAFSEPSRVKLYATMQRRLASMFHEYVPDAYDEKNFRVFIMTKPNID